MVPADSHRVPRAPRYSGCRLAALTLRIRGCHPLRRHFPEASARVARARCRGPTTPRGRRHRPRFGLLPVRSPLLGESLLFSLPGGTKMFGLSQLVASFIASMSQGIRHAPLNTFLAATHDHPTPKGGCARAHTYSRSLRDISRSPVIYSLACPTCQRSRAAFATQVENIGIEPMTSCMPCKRSSQLS